MANTFLVICTQQEAERIKASSNSPLIKEFRDYHAGKVCMTTNHWIVPVMRELKFTGDLSDLDNDSMVIFHWENGVRTSITNLRAVVAQL